MKYYIRSYNNEHCIFERTSHSIDLIYLTTELYKAEKYLKELNGGN